MLKITKLKVIIFIVFIAVSAFILLHNEFPSKARVGINNLKDVQEILENANITVSAKNLPKLPGELPIYEFESKYKEDKQIVSAVLGKDYFQKNTNDFSNDFYELSITGAVLNISRTATAKSTKLPSLPQAKSAAGKWLKEHHLFNKQSTAMSEKIDNINKKRTLNYADIISNFEILDFTLNISVDSNGIIEAIGRNWGEREYSKSGEGKVKIKSLESIFREYSASRIEKAGGPPAPIEITDLDFGYATAESLDIKNDKNETTLYPALKVYSSIGTFYLKASADN